MPSLTFLLPDGSARTLPFDGMPTVMHVAVRQNLPGVVAECGGACACATCLVEIAPEWLERVPPASLDEVDTIADLAASHTPASRLSCQIQLTPALDGLVVRVTP